MLKATTIAAMAALLKIKPEDLTEAIKKTEEVDLPIEEGLQTFTPTELSTRDTTIKDTGKNEHIKAGKEIAIKELKQAAGVEFEGKDPAKFVTEFRTHVIKEAKIPEAEKVTELTTQVTTLKQTLAQKEAEVAQAATRVTEAQREAKILASLPAERNPAFSDSDYLLLIKNKIQVDTVDGKEVFKGPDGQILRDKTAQPLGLEAVVKGVFDASPTWLGGGGGKGGRGGGNTPPPAGGSGGTPVSYSEAVAQWEASGKSINQGEFAAHLQDLQTKNAAFVMDLPGSEPAK
jgi:hypothetical protein